MIFTNLLTKRTMNEDGAATRRCNNQNSTTGRIDHQDDVENDVGDEDHDYVDRFHDGHDDDDENGHQSRSQQQERQPASPVSFYFYRSPTTKSTEAAVSGSPSKDPHSRSIHRTAATSSTTNNTTANHTANHQHHQQQQQRYSHTNPNCTTKSLPSQQPPRNANTSPVPLIRKSKTATLLDDCESGISMNCRCRKATMLVITFFLAIFVAFYSNISLVIRLGATAHNNEHPNPYLLDETYQKRFQNTINSSPIVVDSNSKKSRVDTAIVGDDDDPLEKSDDDGSFYQEENGDDNGTGTTAKSVTTDDGTALDSVTSTADLHVLSSKKTNHNMRMSSTSRSKSMNRNKKYSKEALLQRARRNGKSNGQRTSVKRGNAKANIQDIVPTPEAMSVNASFSACLLIKDDNEILSEWIAYHYHTIKLRHLIVAVDPLSSESPTIVLAKWKLLTDLNIRLWHDEHYMPDDFLETGQAPPNFIATETDLKNSKMRQESIIEISNHRYRQRVFLSSCLRSMRAEGNSWVIHIDSDEYVVPSKLLRQMKPRYVVIPPIEEPGSVLSLIQQVVEKTARNVNYPCISMLRVLFGSVESSLEEQNVGVPEQYNATTFESLRWRYHALPHHAELHGNPKVILDVQAIPAKYFEETIVFSIHRPVREYCPKNSDLAFSNFRKQPIAVNHYLGSWERYSGRNDKRRSRDKYDLKATVNRGHDDGLRTWLRGFVESMGSVNASKLLGDQYLSRNYSIQNDTTTNDSRPHLIVPPRSNEDTATEAS